ncbi:hypothetical protein DIE20_36210 [Burkholderia sp. Bp9131]|nr:hypothetical protein DIE20_36210 [Burkholderia sp. Bp9131]
MIGRNFMVAFLIESIPSAGTVHAGMQSVVHTEYLRSMARAVKSVQVQARHELRDGMGVSDLLNRGDGVGKHALGCACTLTGPDWLESRSIFQRKQEGTARYRGAHASV